MPRKFEDIWEAYLNYFENDNPILAVGKINGINSRNRFNLAWKDLAGILNSLGHGQKTIQQWQKVFSYNNFYIGKITIAYSTYRIIYFIFLKDVRFFQKPFSDLSLF